MTDVAEANERAVVGGNNPPEPTPLEAFTAHVNDLFDSAKDFLDGAAIETEGQAEAISKLLDEARKAERDGTEIRKAETAPIDEAKAAVMDAWRPLVDPKTGRCKLIADTCKKVLAPWLQAKDDAMRAVADAARLDAEQKAAAARSLHDNAGTDLAARETAELAFKDAAKAATAATRADKAKPQATGGSRGVGLRSVWTATIIDRREALKHYIVSQPAEFEALIQSLADSEARHGPRTAPGIQFNEEKVAV